MIGSDLLLPILGNELSNISSDDKI
jgi:hypothetical protein